MAIHLLKRAIQPTPQPHLHQIPGVSHPSYEGPYNIKQITCCPSAQNVVLGEQGEFCMRDPGQKLCPQSLADENCR